MKKTQNELTDLLETWLADAILHLYELEMQMQHERMHIQRLLDMLKELKE